MFDAAFDRSANASRLADETFDVLVIGGGITGCGVALDAAARGLRVALVERDDFASGTSSKSSKLVHGGLRYLQQGDIRLVYQALRERQRLLRNAPHLVRVLPFLIPMFSRDGLINPKLAKALGSAMWMYDLTGGARIGKLHGKVSADETMDYMPTLPRERIAGAYLYYDAQADDARLTLTVARTAAVEFGAVFVNHAPAVQIVKVAGRAAGAIVDIDGEQVEVRAKTVVNAGGVWSDDVRALDEGRDPDSIRPAKGVHVTVPWRLVQNRIAVVAPVPKDKRSVFVVPWGRDANGDPQFTYIGTTDTDYDGPIDDPQCTADDVDYLLRAINFSTTTEITTADVLGTWAGLRPLVKSASSGRTADLSRRHAVNASTSGVVTVTGGKLTTYREMAADTVDALLPQLDAGWRARRSPTPRLALLGADAWDAGVRTQTDRHLADRYGWERRRIERLIADDPSLAEPLVPGLAYLRAEAVFAVRHEMAQTLDDILSRRTRALLQARDECAAAARSIAELVGPDLGWDASRIDTEVSAFVAIADEQRTAPGLPESALTRSDAP